jgi:hypothetical protein
MSSHVDSRRQSRSSVNPVHDKVRLALGIRSGITRARRIVGAAMIAQCGIGPALDRRKCRGANLAGSGVMP